MEKPKCAFKGCVRDGLLQYQGRFICGECLLKIYTKQQEDFWNDENSMQ